MVECLEVRGAARLIQKDDALRRCRVVKRVHYALRGENLREGFRREQRVQSDHAHTPEAISEEGTAADFCVGHD
jgi:hypothetical protein